MELPVLDSGGAKPKSCLTCGYFGLRNQFNGEIGACTTIVRRNGTFNKIPDSKGSWDTAARPACFHAIADLEVEWEANKGAIAAPRDCYKWTQFRHGLTPQEHHAEANMIELELDRRKWEKTMEDDRRANDARQAARERRRDARFKSHERRADRRQNKLVIVIALVGLVIALAALEKDSIILRFFSWLHSLC